MKTPTKIAIAAGLGVAVYLGWKRWGKLEKRPAAAATAHTGEMKTGLEASGFEDPIADAQRDANRPWNEDQTEAMRADVVDEAAHVSRWPMPIVQTAGEWGIKNTTQGGSI